MENQCSSWKNFEELEKKVEKIINTNIYLVKNNF